MHSDDASDQLPDQEAIGAARARHAGDVHWTPLLSSRTLGDRVDGSVWLKCENLQRTGSFKFRGALNSCRVLAERGRLGAAGVLTYSSGNHGQALALAARLSGVPACIVVPEDAPAVKLAAMEGYGARVVPCGKTSQDRYERALELERETGATIVPPFDDPAIIAGQGTTGDEIYQDLPEVDAVLVPTGGGGLLAGVSIALTARNPEIEIWGVEPQSADAMARSLEAGQVKSLDRAPETIADGLCPLAPGTLTFEAAQRHVCGVLRVSEAALRAGQQLLLERAKLFVEPSGAAGAAALEEHRERFEGRRTVLILTGGNAAPPVFDD